MRSSFVFFLFTVIIGFWISCSDSTPIGSGLLADQDLELVFDDDFEIIAKTVITGPTITFTSQNNPINTHLIGQLNDPTFGFSEASYYVQFRYFNTVLPDYTDVEVDSGVLMLEIDTTIFYGSRASQLNFEVFRLRDDIIDLDTITSDQVFAIDPNPIGVLNGYRPSERRSFSFYEPSLRDTLTLSDVIRIPLDLSFVQEIVDAPINETTAADDLLAQFNGFYVRASTDESVIMGFNVGGNSENSVFSLYYTPTDTVSTSFNYLVGFDRPVRFDHDYSGTEIIDILNEPVQGNDPLYIQGMNGVDVELDLSDITKLDDNTLLNHAELELTLATEVLGDTTSFAPAMELGLYKTSSNGELIEVEDLEISERTGGRVILFDGVLQNEGVIQTYSINFSAHIKDILNGSEDGLVYLSIFDKGNDPSRTIIYGPQHDTYPLQLKLTYTKL